MLLLGSFTIVTILVTYYIASKERNPEIIIASVSIVAAFVVSVSFLIVRTFEELVHSNMLKTDFVSIASHQLRTPLSSIRWTLDLLLGNRTGELSSKQRGFVESIQDSNERMMDLVRDLLNVSRIDQGRLVLKRDKVELTNIVEDLIREMSAYAEANHITIALKKRPRKMNVLGDEQYIKMVLENLIDNAIRYSNKEGTIEVTITSKSNYVHVDVTDHGVGIPKNDQKHIFEKFFRSRNIMRQQTEGNGLGLFIVRAVVRGMKGRVGFTSKDSNGSTFWFELPLI